MSEPSAGAGSNREGGRLRVAVVFTDGLGDYARAYVEAITPETDVLLLGPDRFADPEIDTLGAEEVALLPWPRHRQAFASLRLVLRLATRILRFRPDVVHVLSEGQVWLNLLPTLLRPLPLVVTLHDVTPHPGDSESARVPRRLADRFVRRAEAVLVHGEGLKRDACARLGLAPDRVTAIPHAPLRRYRRIADAEGFGKPDDGVFRLLFFGRIFPYKGLQHLIAAEPAVAAAVPNVRTIIAGRGEAVAPYLAGAPAPERFDVRSRSIPDIEAAKLFAEADLLALPYVEASQSGVLAVAASFALPVVASDVGELGATVREGGMGLVTPPGDPSALAEAIIALAHDPARRARMGARAERALSAEAVRTGAFAAYDLAIRRARRSARPDR